MSKNKRLALSLAFAAIASYAGKGSAWAKEQASAAERAAGGTIAGSVKASSAAKFPTYVYVEEVPGGQFSPPDKPVTIGQAKKAFMPGVVAVLAGSTVEFTNEDSFDHNVFSPDFPAGEKGKAGTNFYNLGSWGQGEKRSFTFKKPGVYTQLCSIHPEMVGYVVVLQNPYFAKVDAEGKFQITNVPAGSWKLKIWNERLRPKQLEKSFDIKVSEAGQTDVVLEP